MCKAPQRPIVITCSKSSNLPTATVPDQNMAKAYRSPYDGRMQKDYNQDKEIRNAISKLKRAFMTDDHDLQAQTRVELVTYGKHPAALLLSELDRLDFAKIEYPENLKLIAGLASSLHDVSEMQSRKFLIRTLAGKCHPSVSAMLKSIRRFDSDNFAKCSFGKIAILEEMTLDKSLFASNHVLRWLSNVPGKDLEGIERIYILNDDIERDYIGNYAPRLNLISVVWRRPYFRRFPLNSFRRYEAEKTLYHEIGHHACNHLEMGVVPSQEEEAEDYANRYMSLSHPQLRRFARAVRPVVMPLVQLTLFVLGKIETRTRK